MTRLRSRRGAPKRVRRVNVVRSVALIGALAVAFGGLLVLTTSGSATASTSALAGKTVSQVIAGGGSTCALTTDGDLACWGDNTFGQLGDGTSTPRSIPTAVDVSGTALEGKSLTQVVLADSSACALSSDNSIACWGSNASGQLGDGTTTSRSTPTAVVTTGSPLDGKTIAQIAAGGSTTCALTTDNVLACWGANGSGQLGDTTTTDRLLPTAVSVASTPFDSKTISGVTVGADFSCAVATDSTLACWGANDFGQLGDGTTAAQSVPTGVSVGSTPLDGATIDTIAAGGHHVCVRNDDSVLTCWGENTTGQLGDGSTTDRSVPTAVTVTGTALEGAVAANIVVGGTQTCARLAGGTAACWGGNAQGQLGDGTVSNRPIATAVVTTDTVLEGKLISGMVAGQAHTCALTTDATLACWGDNGSGRLGDDSTTDRPAPVAVVTRPVADITSVGGQRSGVTGYARAGDTVNVDGERWTPNLTSGSFDVTIGGVVAQHTASTDAEGVLTASVTVPPAADPGSVDLVLTQGTDVVTIPVVVLGDRTVTLSPTSGDPGTEVTVSGSGFDSGAELGIVGRTTSGVPTTDDPVSANASAAGTFSTSYVVEDGETTAIEAHETTPGGDPEADLASAPFTPNAATIDVASILGQRSGVVGYARVGDQLSVTGAHWYKNVAAGGFAATFCDSSGTPCDAPISNTLTTDASGQMSGTLVAPLGTTSGNRVLKVIRGSIAVTAPIVILDARSITVSPVSAGVGSSITVTGDDFDPQAPIEIRGITALAGPTWSSDTGIEVTASASGAFETTFVVNDPTTIRIRAFETTPDGDPANDFANANFAVIPASASVASITGQRAGVVGIARAGDVVLASGTDWLPNVSAGLITASFCDATGTTCAAPAVNTLTTGPSGALSGNVAVPNGTSSGPRGLKVVQGGSSALIPISILGTRTVVLSPNAGPAGQAVGVSGANFDPQASLEVRGAKATVAGAPVWSSDAALAVTATSTGAVSASYAVNDDATSQIYVYETDPEGSPDSDNAVANYTIDNRLDRLSMFVLPDPANSGSGSVILPATTTSTQPTLVSGTLNPIQVADFRSSTYGWSLTAQASDFTSGANTISKDHMSLTPTCSAASPNSAPGYTAGSAAQSFSGTVMVCSKDDQVGATSGTTAGVYDAHGVVSVEVPAFQPTGEYRSTITLTLA